MKPTPRSLDLPARLAMLAATFMVGGCMTASYTTPTGVPTANIRFREVEPGYFAIYQSVRLPGCYVPSDPLEGGFDAKPIGQASIRSPLDKSITLITFHREWARLGMPIDGKYVEWSYFELKMPADKLLTLRALVPGYDRFDTAFRFTPKAGENYEVTVRSHQPLQVEVHRIDTHDGHYTLLPVDDVEIVRRCTG